MKITDVQVAQFIKLVLAGQPGRGKTCCGITFPTPMLIFDFDQKLDGPILFAKKLGIDLSQIEVEHISDWRKIIPILDAEVKNPKFKTYGFDSLTTLADLLLAQIETAKLADKGSVKRIGGIPVPGIEEYNAESSGIMDLLLFMRAVRAHVWLTAHVIETRTQVIGEGPMKIVVNRTLLTGGKKVAAKIPAYFPENYSIQIEPPIASGDPPKFFVHTTSNTEDYGRTGFNLPARFEITGRPFFATLMSLIGQQPS